jgi:hypothetical protein
MSARHFLLFVALSICVASLGAAAWSVFCSGGPAGLTPSSANGVAKQNPQEELEFDRTDVDLGSLRAAGECTFNFVNRSVVPVTVNSIQASCSCTIAELETKTYPPGGCGRITVRMHPRAERIGYQSSQILVEYTGLERRTARLMIRLRGRPGVTSSILRTTPLALDPLPKAEVSHGWDG